MTIARENKTKARFFEFSDPEALQEFSIKERFGDIPTAVMEFNKDPELMRLINHDDYGDDVKKVKRKASKDPSKTQFTMKFSTYNPTQAKFVIDFYTEPGWKILDPFMGRYTRPITSLYLDRKYFGVDTCEKTVESNAEAIRNKFPDKSEMVDWQLFNESGTDLSSFKGEENIFDAVFSCPPYYDIEKYSGDDGDISHMSNTDFDREIQKMFHSVYPLVKPSDYDAKVFHPVIMTVGSQRKGKHGLVNDMQFKFKYMAFKAGFILHDILFTVNRTPLKYFDANKAYQHSRVVKNFETTLVFLKQPGADYNEFMDNF